jgi:hypothetical protein
MIMASIVRFIADVRAFWPLYVWHHRRPWTRRLHQLGSWSCIAFAIVAIANASVGPLALGLTTGYAFAFAGHYFVEHNRPLTFGRPVLAGVCNWIMFALEITGRLGPHLERLEERVLVDLQGADQFGPC